MRGRSGSRAYGRPAPWVSVLAGLGATLLFAAPAAAQEPAAEPLARFAGYGFVAPGLAFQESEADVLAHFGAGLEVGRRLRGTVEAGYMTSALALLSPEFDGGFFAFSVGALYRFPTEGSLRPLLRGGYIGLSGEGEYVDGPYAGGGLDLALDPHLGLLLELRDFLLPERDANGLELRLGLAVR